MRKIVNKLLESNSIYIKTTYKPAQYFKKTIKKPITEDWVVKKELKLVKEADNLDHMENVKFIQGNMEKTERGLREQKPIPVSPCLYPVTVQNPKISSKKYRWCTCGLSLKQPWCDRSHAGTAFLPIIFSIEEAVKEITLCGCKLSSKAPFCDKKACLIAKGEIDDDLSNQQELQQIGEENYQKK